MWDIYYYNINKTHTMLYCIEDIFKPLKNKNGENKISENVNPVLVMFILMTLRLSKTFLLVLTNIECPHIYNEAYRYV